MTEEIMNNEMIKKLQKIEEKYTNKYLREELKEIFNDVVQKNCKDFKENIFYKQVVEIDEELDLFPSSKYINNNKTQKRLKIYNDSDDDDEEEIENSIKKGKK